MADLAGVAAIAAPSLAPPPPPPKLRLLALHGFGQTASSFRSRSGSWRKGLNRRAEFFYVDAPFTAPGAAGDGDGGLSWWSWEGGGDAGTRPSRSERPIVGWADSRAVILEALQAHAPIDGLLGFSQGAAAAGWFVSEMVSGAVPCPPGVPPLKLAILASGFIPGDAGARGAFEVGGASLLPPTLHIVGEADETVEAARSGEVERVWRGEESQWLRHPGGHCLPTCSGEVKARVVAFLDGVGVRVE